MRRSRRAAALAAGLLMCSCFLIAPSPARAGRVTFVSPVDGARGILPVTTLLVRYDGAPALAGGDLAKAFEVTGSVSGPHAGRAHFSRDGDALLFEPATPFALGERVTVRLSDVAAPDPGRLGSARSFAFDVAPRLSPRRGALPDVDGFAPIGVRAPSAPAAANDTLPADFPDLVTQQLGACAPGQLFLANIPLAGDQTPYIMVVDNAGTPLWYRAMPGWVTDFRRHANGDFAYFDNTAGVWTVLDSTLTPSETWQAGNGYFTDNHEFRMLPNGHALLLAVDPQVVDMSAVVPGGQPAATVLGMVVQELDADRNVVFQWRSFDHVAITDCMGINLTGATIDYVHSNAVDVADDGNLVLSSRHLSEITKIDRTTGDVLWRWGGKHNQFTFVGDTLPFDYQHGIRQIANGHYTLFDNGTLRSPSWSRACEYALDEVNHTATLVWSYRPNPDVRALAMGFVQRLSNGNTLVSFGTGKPDAIEVTPEGDEVLMLSLPDQMSSYRVLRKDWDPVPLAVTNARESLDLAFLGPNPAHGSTTLLARLPHAGRVSLRVFDLQGREVAAPLPPSVRNAGVLTIPLRLEGRPSGVYFCRLDTERGSATRRLLLVH